MIPALSSALNGIQSNQKKFLRHADNISHYGLRDPESSEPEVDLAEEMVGIKQSQRGIEAGGVVLRAADEMFITSTAGGVMPVTRISNAPLGDGKPGSLTARLNDGYWAMHDDPGLNVEVEY